MVGLRSAVVLACFAVVAASQATLWTFTIAADGLQEVPPTPSAGIGVGVMQYDDVTNFFSLDMALNGITATSAGQITATRLFKGPAGSNGTQIDDLSVLCNWFGTNGNFTLFAPVQYVLNESHEADLLAGNTYLNIHTAQFQSGEIRGQFQPVPEPGSMVVLGLGAAALLRRKLRQKA